MRYLTVVLTGVVATGLVLSIASGTIAQPLTKAAMQEFMLTADIVESEPIGKGVTHPWRLTLSDGAFSHDVAFQSVNQKRDRQRLGRRTRGHRAGRGRRRGRDGVLDAEHRAVRLLLLGLHPRRQPAQLGRRGGFGRRLRRGSGQRTERLAWCETGDVGVEQAGGVGAPHHRQQ